MLCSLSNGVLEFWMPIKQTHVQFKTWSRSAGLSIDHDKYPFSGTLGAFPHFRRKLREKRSVS
jgi:hypothetical protein